MNTRLFFTSFALLLATASFAQIDIDDMPASAPKKIPRIATAADMIDPQNHPVWQNVANCRFPEIERGSCQRTGYLFEVPLLRDSNGDLIDPSISGNRVSVWIMESDGSIILVSAEIPLGGGLSNWQALLRDVTTVQEPDGRITYRYVKPLPITITKAYKPNWAEYRYFL